MGLARVVDARNIHTSLRRGMVPIGYVSLFLFISVARVFAVLRLFCVARWAGRYLYHSISGWDR